MSVSPFDFEAIVGSIVGRNHLTSGGVLIGDPNQDAFAYAATEADADHPFRTFVVCDGCSSSKKSEVGSRIGSRLVALAITKVCRTNFRLLQSNAQSDREMFWAMVKENVLAQMKVVALAMSDTDYPETLYQTLAEYFLFTIVGVVMTPHRVTLFNIGDGVFFVNDKMIMRGPFEGNAPPYLAYDLMPDEMFNPEELDKIRSRNFFTLEICPICDVTSLLVGTDGVMDLVNCEGKEYPGGGRTVAPVNHFWKDPSFFKNPAKLQRELRILNSEKAQAGFGETISKFPGLLPDDCTMFVIKRKSESEEG